MNKLDSPAPQIPLVARVSYLSYLVRWLLIGVPMAGVGIFRTLRDPAPHDGTKLQLALGVLAATVAISVLFSVPTYVVGRLLYLKGGKVGHYMTTRTLFGRRVDD